jgi:two-component system response regulator VanR
MINKSIDDIYNKKLLVVEDEPEIRDILNNYLTNEGYEVVLASDGVEAISLFAGGSFDLVILDIMMPKIDGYGVCEVIKKQSDVPVIFLSALNDDKSQIKGYDLMADDYVTKPFSMPIFLRKVNALLRRSDSAKTRHDKVLICGDIIINSDTMSVTVKGKNIELTSREFDILLTLAKNPGRVYSREMLLNLLWDFDSLVDERIVDSHIKNLRHKIGGDYIETVRGRGYRIDKKTD